MQDRQLMPEHAISTASASGAGPHPNTPSMRFTIINAIVRTTTSLSLPPRHRRTHTACPRTDTLHAQLFRNVEVLLRAAGASLDVNPKAWIAIATVFASTRLAKASVVDATLKALLPTLMVVLIHGTWLLAGRLLAGALVNPVRARTVNVVLAGLVVVATVLALLP